MKYLKEKEDKVLVYDVTFSKENLIKLRSQIINRCGKREHKSYDTDYLINNCLYENYKEKYLGKKEYFEETRDVYHIEYDQIHEPQLATLIGSLIYNNDLAIISYIYENKELVDYNDGFKDKKILYLKKLQSLIHEGIDTKKVRNILDMIDEIDMQINLNEKLNLEDQRSYIYNVKKEIKLTLEDELDLDTYNKVTTLNKILKR